MSRPLYYFLFCVVAAGAVFCIRFEENKTLAAFIAGVFLILLGEMLVVGLMC